MPKKKTEKVLDVSGWPTKAEAAERMFTSEKSVERWADAGKIAAAWRPIPGRRPIRVYNPDDVERIRAEQIKGLVPVVEQGETTLARKTGSAGGIGADDLVKAFEAAIRMTVPQMIEAARAEQKALPPASEPTTPTTTTPTEPAVRIAEKPLLTLAEASHLTGLSRGILRGAIEARKLKGKVIGRAWRIRRTDLDAYVSKL